MNNIHFIGILVLLAAICFDLNGCYVGIRRALLKGGISSIPFVTLPFYLLVYGLNPEFHIVSRLVDALVILIFHFAMHIFIPVSINQIKHR